MLVLVLHSVGVGASAGFGSSVSAAANVGTRVGASAYAGIGI